MRVGPLALALALAILGSAGARAQSPDPGRVAAAQALYEAATADLDAGRTAQACRTLEEVVRLVPSGLGAKLTLGDCYAALGKRASAWSQYTAVESLATAAGQLDRASRAAEKAAALRPALATLTVEVPVALRTVPGLTITRDGVPVGDVQWGVAIPADAGVHHLVFEAPGHEPFATDVQVPEDGAAVTVEVTLGPPLPAEAPAPAVPLVPTLPPPMPGPLPPPTEDSVQGPLGIALLGVGTAGLVVAGVLGILALGHDADSKEPGRCDEADLCDAVGLDLRDQALAFATASTVTFVVGGAVLVGGVVVVATAPSASDATPAEGAQARLALSPGGLVLEGAW